MALLSLRVPITRALSAGVFGGLGLYGRPLGEGSWFNEPLGRTNVAHVDVGIVWRL